MGNWVYILPRKHHYNSKLCTLNHRAAFCQPESVVPLVRMKTPPYAHDCDGESWWRSVLLWPAVSGVYDECHHGWQPSCSMIYTLRIARGTWRVVTTCLRRSRELFQARGVLDASRHNDTLRCLKFNRLNTVQTFPGDAFQMCLSFHKESVLFTTVQTFRLYTPVTIYWINIYL